MSITVCRINNDYYLPNTADTVKMAKIWSCTIFNVASETDGNGLILDCGYLSPDSIL